MTAEDPTPLIKGNQSIQLQKKKNPTQRKTTQYEDRNKVTTKKQKRIRWH